LLQAGSGASIIAQAAGKRKEGETMAWNLKGQLVESCSCNMFCPCWFGVQDLMIMDQGWCAGVLGFRIRKEAPTAYHLEAAPP
jgi:hypothetical protein